MYSFRLLSSHSAFYSLASCRAALCFLLSGILLRSNTIGGRSGVQDWPSETTELKESFEKLPSELREAIFRLGWTAVTWGAGHCAAKTWVLLSEEEKAAAAQLQLDASSWPGINSLQHKLLPASGT